MTHWRTFTAAGRLLIQGIFIPFDGYETWPHESKNSLLIGQRMWLV